MELKRQKCCICGNYFIGYGNNPCPVKSTGVCCDTCNQLEVIPYRLKLSRKNKENKD